MFVRILDVITLCPIAMVYCAVLSVRTHAISAVQDVLEVCAAVSSAGQWEPGDRPVGTSVKCPGKSSTPVERLCVHRTFAAYTTIHSIDFATLYLTSEYQGGNMFSVTCCMRILRMAM